jgi:pimeloyl-ACP methyl ester carboxylesterase
MTDAAVQTLIHAKIRLALHSLQDRPGPCLLLLHGLGQCAPRQTPDDVATWPGSIFALDFTGHGASTVPRGGGYTAEQLMGDADAALEKLGAVTVLGRGVGGYVAALLAGARPQQVRGAIICDGPGLLGGGSAPGQLSGPVVVSSKPGADRATPDSFAVQELSRDLRPPDYALTFARQAMAGSEISQPIAVCASERPGWLAALLDSPAAATSSVVDALARYAGVLQ